MPHRQPRARSIGRLGWLRRAPGDPPINGSHALPRGLLLFWSVWLSVVFSSNLADGLQQAGALPETWRFASGNFTLVLEAIGIYGLPKALAVALFAGVVLAQLGAVVLFWRASLDREAVSTRGHPKVVHAFLAAGAVFAAFLVSDELFIVYDRLPALETTHLLVFCALFVSFLVVSSVAESPRTD